MILTKLLDLIDSSIQPGNEDQYHVYVDQMEAELEITRCEVVATQDAQGNVIRKVIIHV